METKKVIKKEFESYEDFLETVNGLDGDMLYAKLKGDIMVHFRFINESKTGEIEFYEDYPATHIHSVTAKLSVIEEVGEMEEIE